MFFDLKKGFDDDNLRLSVLMPIIAISANIMNENSALHFAYSQAIIDAGGVPIIIPDNTPKEALHSLVGSVDGLLLSGGDDIDGAYFGEENIPNLTELNELRDYYEFALLRTAMDRGVPVLGICRGCQVVNVALGGSIYQDLPTMYTQAPLVSHSILTDKHLPVHDINIVEGSLLHSIVGTTNMGVNSRHHQAIKDVAPTLKAVAHSVDGVVEGVEGYPFSKVIALQCHPENMATTGGVPEMKQLFSFFVGEADLYHQAKMIHSLNPIVDSHCDTPMLYDLGGFDFSQRCSNAKVDLVKMNEGMLDATITVAYIPQSTPMEEATEIAFSTLKRFGDDISKLSNKIVVARSAEDVIYAKSKGLKSVMLGVENGHAIGLDIDNIDRLKELGVVYITLCHNGSNAICDSARGRSIYGGVSDFGAKVIERMNQLGVTVDVSHTSEQSTLDALRLSTQPIIASHSSCKALCDHPRNLSDDVIKLIADKGGVVQVCGYGGFLNVDESRATLFDIVNHIEHVVNLVGYDHVGIGSDFDGGGGVEGFEDASKFLNLTVELLRHGHSADNIAKIMGGNILRVISQNSKIK
ncbi:MAG: membrane dipeptidase [Rikenellaceae bacterium]